MSKLSRVTLRQALGYRGGQPMIVWILHRLTGLGIILFVGMHVLAAFFKYSTEPGVANSVAVTLTSFYETLGVQVVVLFCVLYHAVNGLRIVILDMWPSLIHYNREAMWVQWALFLPLFLVPAVLMILRSSIV
jgi:succinate dehydrogenase / fumarate reductase, cytochrome b subunit